MMLELTEAETVWSTHLFPRLLLFLCLGTGGVGRLAATEASGQVGLLLNLTVADTSDGPKSRNKLMLN